MTKRTVTLGLAAAVLVSIFAACGGSGSESSSSGPNAGNGGAGGTNGQNGSGAAGSTGNGFGGDLVGEGGRGQSSGEGGAASCAGQTSTAELVPLDLYIMLDSSGSMDESTGTGTTKWDAVTAALETFFTAPESAGLGVGLQFFPLPNPGVPDSCRNNGECNGGGPCVFRVCEEAFGTIPCDSDADCPSGTGACVALGACSFTGDLCLPAGTSCAPGEGQCRALTRSFCAEENTCDPNDYASPAVDIAPLDANTAGALVNAMNDKDPTGATPTASALSGAIQQAQSYAAANPTHRVVAVLATDGLPTQCLPQDDAGIAAIAADGASGSPGISTFVIGVFSNENIARAQGTMDAIASAGGTTEAFIVDASQDVSEAFLNALNAIRGESLACEYQVPTPTGGQTIDYGEVNVEHLPPNASDASTIFYVTNEAGCDPVTGGWYYDVDPAAGGTPTKLVMCPATCALFREGGQVEIRVGCKTEVAEPL